MKCRKCSKTAVIHLRGHNIALCDEHFIEFFESRVEKAIQKFKMFTKNEKVLVAISSGKDSSALLYVLTRLGYNVSGVFLKMGRHTQLAEKTVKEFSEKTGVKIDIYDTTQHFGGRGTYEISTIVRRPVCSVCGIVRRYWFNRYAIENGYKVVATGHNMDDEATFLLGNILNWQTEYLLKQSPILMESDLGFVRKVKPLIYLSERETFAYVFLNKIPFLEQKCPFSSTATSSKYKKYLNQLEYEQPGIKHRFLFGSLENKKIFETSEKENPVNNCPSCGMPTGSDGKCQYCRLVEMVANQDKT